MVPTLLTVAVVVGGETPQAYRANRLDCSTMVYRVSVCVCQCAIVFSECVSVTLSNANACLIFNANSKYYCAPSRT